jgi:hypothetical protein
MKIRRARGFLMKQLKDEPQDFHNLVRRAEAEGISSLTLRRAARAIGVKMKVTGFGTNKRSKWSLDADAHDALAIHRTLLRKEIDRVERHKAAAENDAESAFYFKMLSALRGLH